MTAIYLAEIATPRVKEVAKPMVEMLASLPSVVIGFFRHGCCGAVSSGRL